MGLDKRLQEEALRIKRMGWTLLGFASLCCIISFFLPENEAIYLLSSEGKQGFYILSILLIFLGLYCLGSIWRRRHFF